MLCNNQKLNYRLWDSSNRYHTDVTIECTGSTLEICKVFILEEWLHLFLSDNSTFLPKIKKSYDFYYGSCFQLDCWVAGWNPLFLFYFVNMDVDYYYTRESLILEMSMGCRETTGFCDSPPVPGLNIILIFLLMEIDNFDPWNTNDCIYYSSNICKF